MARQPPLKPWENRQGGQNGAPAQSAATPAPATTQAAAPTLTAPALPDRPAAMAATSEWPLSKLSDSLDAREAAVSPYNSALTSRYGTTGYGSYPGLGSYGSYGSFGSPYSRFGTGGFGMNSFGYGGGMGYGSMGYGGMGMQGVPGQVGPDGLSLTQRMESGTQATFQIIESIVGAFAGFSQMLESTFMATHSSFFAMIGVAEQFGSLRNYLGQVLSIFTLINWARGLLARLTGRDPPPGTMDPFAPVGFNADAFRAFENGQGPGPSAPPRPSRKPIVVFFLTVIGLPYLMTRLIRLINARQLEEARARGDQPDSGTAIDPANLTFVRATHAYTAADANMELSFQPNDIIAVLTPMAERTHPGWWRGRLRDGRVGFFPSTHVQEVPMGKQQPAAAKVIDDGPPSAGADGATTLGSEAGLLCSSQDVVNRRLLISTKMSQDPSQAIPSASASNAEELHENTIIVVLGASGDLAKKKTFPALFGLFVNGFLPPNLHIVGYARTKMDKEEFEKRVTSHIQTSTPPQRQKLPEFLKICSYVSGQYDKEEDFKNLTKELEKIEDEIYDKSKEQRNRMFYMALPPSVFISVAENLKKACYSPKGVNRIVVEKPFGKDLQSARDMMGKLKQAWKEEETFRIDHYLGKEMVKNMLVLRFGNVFIDSTFNRQYISNVQIVFKEPFGTEGRGGYFDEFGIIRDVMQNHLLQVLSILTMERPFSFASEDIRDEKVKTLRYIKPISPDHALLGQYVANGKDKPGYLDDETVPKGSHCPTFAALVLYIDSPRWEGVPFILRAGKALDEQKTEVRVQYKDTTAGIFSEIARNELVIRVQPNEAVYLKLNLKAPGLHMRTVTSELDMTYKRRFSDLKIPEAYESLILDAFKGDHSNFVRDDELDIAWKIFTPLLHHIEQEKPKLYDYKYGERGPDELSDFIARFAGYKRSTGYSYPTTNVSEVGAEEQRK